jgi:hypothetical protein
MPVAPPGEDKTSEPHAMCPAGAASHAFLISADTGVAAGREADVQLTNRTALIWQSFS